MTTPDAPGPPDSGSEAPSGTGRWPGVGLIALLVAYTYAVHRGFGPQTSAGDAWYAPTSFVFSAPLLSELTATIGSSLAWFVTPALLLAIAVMLTNRSALARALAISCVIACVCFVYYGVQADQIWSFFRWRASAVLALMSCAVGFSIAAPMLAGSWLRLGWPARIAAYLPFVAFVLGFMRNATGTDPTLQFAISPWPAVSVFGIGLGAMFVAILLVGLAFGVWGLAAGRGPGVALLGIALGLVAPLGLLLFGDAIGVFPFSVGSPTLIAMAIACAVAIAIGAALPARGVDGRRGRARRLAVGAALLALPVISGQALARYDYYVTREVLARRITDALAAYLEKEEIYPDELDELVADGYLDEIPSPRIGFAFLHDDAFRYRSFGTSFILEFPAPGWVECAYTPPYEGEQDAADDEFGVGSYDNPLGEGQYVDSYFEKDAIDAAAAEAAEAAEDEAAGDDEPSGDSLGEAWSCPSAPPKLW